MCPSKKNNLKNVHAQSEFTDSKFWTAFDTFSRIKYETLVCVFPDHFTRGPREYERDEALMITVS